MAYVAPIHKPSSVRHALKLKFLDPNEDCLVVAKANRLEFYNLNVDPLDNDAFSLQLAHTRSIFGRAIMLAKIRPASSTTDHLFIGTDRYNYFTLSWDAETRSLKTPRSFVDLADRASRDAQHGDRVLIDPSGRFMTLELYEGTVTVIPIVQPLPPRRGRPQTLNYEVGALGEPSSTRIDELMVRSSAFLYTDDHDDEAAGSVSSGKKANPRMALLFETSQQKVRLQIRDLEFQAAPSGESGTPELVEKYKMRQELELGASHIIPIEMPAGGLLILGETSITYLDIKRNDVKRQPLESPTVFVAWEKVDALRWLLADDYGRLYFMMLKLDSNNNVESWQVDFIGKTSRASTLVYLDAGHFFVGSHHGDSKVIKLAAQSFEVVQSFNNIAPITDFAIMDLGNRSDSGSQAHEFSSGQARIVTGSGVFDDGSLRSVRSGVGIEELGVIDDVTAITDLFPLATAESSLAASQVDTLVVSFFDYTRIFSFSQGDEQIEELGEFMSFDLGAATLVARNLSSDRLLQVTPVEVAIVDLRSGSKVANFRIPEGSLITSASANETRLLVAVDARTLMVFDLATAGQSVQVVAQKEVGTEKQIAGLTVEGALSNICVVTFWETAEVVVYDLQTLNQLHVASIGQPMKTVPRSVVIAQILPEPAPRTLFVSTADGHVITFSLNADQTLSGESRMVLGSNQVLFKTLPRSNGLHNVFVACEQPTLIYSNEGRMVYAAVNTEFASRVCAFNAVSFPGAIAIATERELKICLIETERMTQIQSLYIGEIVRRIAYSEREKAFGLGTIKRSLTDDGEELVQSHFKLADEVTFRELDTYDLDQEEMIESTIRAELPISTDANGDRVYEDVFIVGTCFLDEPGADVVGAEGIKGRLLIFRVTPDKKLKLMREAKVKGSVTSLGFLDGKIVAGLLKTVVVYIPTVDSFGTISLEKDATYRCSTKPIDIAISHGNPALGTQTTIAVADLCKSLTILKYEAPATPGAHGALTEIARHYATVWTTSVAQVAANTWLQADAENNLLLLARNESGVTADDKRRLAVTGEFNLGELVNRIRPITTNKETSKLDLNGDQVMAEAAVSAVDSDDSVLQPKAFLGTVDGSVYLFALINDKALASAPSATATAKYGRKKRPIPTPSQLLLNLQSAIFDRLSNTSPGHLPFARYRALRNQALEHSNSGAAGGGSGAREEPFRFVDGECLLWWLDSAEEEVQRECLKEAWDAMGLWGDESMELGDGDGDGKEKGEEDGDIANDDDDDDDEFVGSWWSFEGVKLLVEGFRRFS